MPDAGAVHEDGLLDEVAITFPADNDAKKKRKRKPVEKFNPNHDGNGRFATGGDVTQVQLSAQSESDMTPEARANIGEALSAISTVIKRTPAIKTLTVHVQSPKDMPEGNSSILGFYNPVDKGKITLSKHSDAETLVHEYAHMLDYEQLGGKASGSASGGMHLDRPGNKLSDLGAAIAASPEAKNTFGQHGGYMQQYVTYHQEVFARAFSQYVATKSGNPHLLSVIHGDSTQWSDENFKPISDAMDGYLRSQGLLGVSMLQKFNQNHDERGRFSSGDSLGRSIQPHPGDVEDMRNSSISSKYIREDGSFTPERAALHDKIVSDFLKGVPSQERPTQYFNGGGPGSGKSSMTSGANAKLVGYPGTRSVDGATGAMDFARVPRPDAVLIDPDAVKLQFPEVQAALKSGDQSWAHEAHAESSYVSKRLMQAALDRKVNIVNDGTGDSGAEKMKAKAAQAKAAGYRTEANYLHLNPEEGVTRALARAKRSGRMVPPTVIRKTYANLPSVFHATKDSTFDNVRLFDNDGVPQGQPARLIGATNNGSFEIFDQPAYDNFMAGN